MQTEITQRLDRFLEGAATDDKKSIPMTPVEDVYPGRAAVRSDNDTDGTLGRMPNFNKLTLTFAASLITSDVTAGTINVYNTAGTLLSTGSVSKTYATSHNLTIEQIRAQLAALPSATAVTSDTVNNRVIELSVANDYRLDLATAFTATGGAAPTITNTKGSNDTLIGVWKHVNTGNVDGAVTYEANKRKFPVLRQGDIAVHAQDSVEWGETPRAILEADGDHGRGTFTNDSTIPSLALAQGIFASGTQNDLALLSVNQP